ncbi:HlyD family efflux transporter periplasmic adaptor subunit [Gammaproteobacteria bacterium]|nr:HlyD family efflux transporter periplasmic adaptor subunit [Gammaproteobacteria bacterium]
MSKKVSFNQECEFIARQKIPKLASITLLFVSVLMVTMIAYGFFIEVDVKTTATGAFEFGAKNKHFIESNAPGVVRQVLVKTGQKVNKGETVVIMENPALIESYLEEKSKLKAMELSLYRLESERDKKDLIFTSEDIRDYPDMVENERHHFKMDTSKHLADKKELEEAYHIADREYQLMLPLLEGGHIAKFEMEKQKRKVDSAKAAFENVDNQRVSAASRDIKETHHKIDGQEKKVARLYEQVRGLKVKAPIEGIVSSKAVSVRGANIKKSDRVLELVEPDSSLVVNILVSPDQIGFIKVGQLVNIKIDTFDFSIYGKVDGEVSSISYTPVLKNAATVYEVSVKPKTQYLEYKDKKIDIIPGMTCVVDILTSKVSLMYYIMKPVTKNFTDAEM